MQVFTQAKSIRGIKREPDAFLQEDIDRKQPVNISWKHLYAHPPAIADFTVTRLDSQLKPQTAVHQKADVNHDEVHQLVHARLKILRFIHSLLNGTRSSTGGDDRRYSAGLAEEEEILIRWRNESVLSQSESRDGLSFYLCALGMCDSSNSWDWFCHAEEALFRARLLGIRQADREILYREQHVFLDSVDPRKELTQQGISAEKTRLYRDLLIMENRFPTKPHRRSTTPQAETWPQAPGNSFQVESNFDSQWYRTKLEFILDLVRRRDIVLHQGFAYVQSGHLQNILLAQFRKRMDGLQGHAMEQRSNLHESEWSYFLQIIETLCNIEEIERPIANREAPQNLDVVKPQDIDYLSEHHFPPCMQQLHGQLTRDRHLKYHGRWQYGLFLKRIGLSMEDALDFFGSKETMGSENFRRSRYGYSIRHYYGQEGKHTNYSTMGCSAIIMGAPPTPSSCHGCPFKHEQTGSLKSMITQQCDGVKEEDIEDIIGAREGQHYSRACFHFFKLKHPSYAGENLFSSPYEFYLASTSSVVKKEEPSGE
ncbi:DNA primase large subunit [Perkinsela sp. CCAP 1560/4]|nr:DNA primase large subunit [Perkinsela sp. CCAP 1560/4]|eukprot:KNH07101.1 DNA primase large subunit [Perkinsela sp. CCAP 1560/4]